MPRLPLAVKLLGVLFVTLALSVLGLGYWSLATHAASLEQAYAKHGRALAQAVSAAIATREELNAAGDLAVHLRQQLDLHPDLRQIDVAVPTANGWQVRASTHPDRTSVFAEPDLQRVSENMLQGGEPAIVFDVFDGQGSERFARAAAPVRVAGQSVGVVVATLSLASMQTALHTQQRMYITAGLGLACVLGLTLFLALRHTVLQPLTLLGEAVEAIGRRDPEHALRIERCDEFGQLSRSFNLMAKALREAEIQAEHLAFHDALTDLPNRRLLINRLDRAIAATSRYGRRGALLYIDLDGFKRVNDSLGHSVGDGVLAEASGRLLDAVRQVDTVARIGGDEFVILLHELPADAPAAQQRVHAVANKVLQAFEQPIGNGRDEFHLGVSIGGRIFDHEDLSAEAILQDADEAMYLAKRAGGQQLRFFAYDEVKSARRRHAIRRALPEAIEKQAIQAYFQPQFDASGAIHGVEALLRWPLPDWGFAPPRDVVQVAEELGLAGPLGELMVRRAACAFHQCAAVGHKLGHVAVNLSPVQFTDQGFADNLIALRNEVQLPWGALVVEITEHAFLNDIQGVSAIISRLRAHGIKLVIDGFGTGYASTNYPRHLPVDGIKIDQSFVAGMTANEHDHGLVGSLIHMAAELNLSIACEGVETRGHLQALREMGCERFQGHYFSEAIELARLLRLLESPPAPQWFGERRQAIS